MTGYDWLAERFEENRVHLRAVAYHILGSVNEADDAIRETWLRLIRSDASAIEKSCGMADDRRRARMLGHAGSRTSRREESMTEYAPEPSIVAAALNHGLDGFADAAVGFDSCIPQIIESAQDVVAPKRREPKTEPAFVDDFAGSELLPPQRPGL